MSDSVRDGLTKIFNRNLPADAFLLQQAESALSEEAHQTSFSLNPSRPILVQDRPFSVSLNLPTTDFVPNKRYGETAAPLAFLAAGLKAEPARDCSRLACALAQWQGGRVEQRAGGLSSCRHGTQLHRLADTESRRAAALLN